MGVFQPSEGDDMSSQLLPTLMLLEFQQKGVFLFQCTRDIKKLVNKDIKLKADVEGKCKWVVEDLSQKIGEFSCTQRVLLSCLLAIWRLVKFTKTRWTNSKWCNLLFAWLVCFGLFFHLNSTDLRFVVPLSGHHCIQS